MTSQLQLPTGDQRFKGPWLNIDSDAILLSSRNLLNNISRIGLLRAVSGLAHLLSRGHMTSTSSKLSYNLSSLILYVKSKLLYSVSQASPPVPTLIPSWNHPKAFRSSCFNLCPPQLFSEYLSFLLACEPQPWDDPRTRRKEGSIRWDGGQVGLHSFSKSPNQDFISPWAWSSVEPLCYKFIHKNHNFLSQTGAALLSWEGSVWWNKGNARVG